jgi:uncharacterized membrane protein YidH (DUF202 family)
MPDIEIPLHLCQVLEEEFESLHETLDADETPDAVAVSDDAGEVFATVKGDWDFHENHVRSGRLAERLARAWRRWEEAHPGERQLFDGGLRGIEPDLEAYLAFRHESLLKPPPDDSAGEADKAAYEAAYLVAVRALLDDGELFKRERFEHLTTLREETRGLAELVWAGDGGMLSEQGGRRSDLTRFRRLLLEDAFPEEIRRAYDLRLARVVRRVHELGAGRSAVCLSGGGIRSGTFALGVLQSLAGRHFLDRFDYLSTVSGGGYIGGWLSAWIHRHEGGLSGVVGELNGARRASKLEPEPEPLRRLRDYSNFITPKTGILSADSWTFIIIYVRNLLLNWVVLVPLLASLLVVPRVSVATVLAPMRWRTVLALLAFGCVGAALLRPSLVGSYGAALRWARQSRVLAVAAVLLLVAAAALVAVYFLRPDWSHRLEVATYDPRATLLVAGALLNGYAVAFMRLSRPSNSGVLRPGSFWDRCKDQNTFLWFCLLPLCVSGTLLTTFWAWHARTPRPSQAWEFAYFLVFGLAVWLVSLFFYWLFVSETWKFYRRQLDGLSREVESLRREKQKLEGAARAEEIRHVEARLEAKAEAERALGARVEERRKTVNLNVGREAISLLVSSALGAFLLWVAATRIGAFDRPVVDPVGWVWYLDGPSYWVMSAQGHRYELLPYQQWWGAEIYTVLAFPVYLLVIFLSVTLFVGFTSRRTEVSPRERQEEGPAREGFGGLLDWLRHPFDKVYVEDEDREWLARASAWLFIVMAGWLFFSVLVIFGPLVYFALEKWLLAAGGLSGLVTVLGGRSAATPGHAKKGEPQGGWRETLSSLGVNLIVVAAFVFFACLVLATGLLTGTVIAWLGQYLPGFLAGPHGADFAAHYPLASAQDAMRVTHFPTWFFLSLLALALHGVGRFFSHVINLNKFSLHAGYRDRIVRAFLGASRPRGERQANPFTGFDPRDDLYMSELSPWALREADFAPGGLASFVAALTRPEGAPPPGGAPEEEGAADRALAARILRAEIDRLEGKSKRFFEQKDLPQSIETNPSFRSALFGDLGRIMQSSRLEEFDGFRPYAEAARAEYAGLAEQRGPGAPSGGGPQTPLDRLLLNRLLLLKAFPDSLTYPPRLYRRLLHVVNMALNLVGGDRLAWQQRRAESFTSTSLHSGSLFVGYRHTRQYGGNNGIKLGTAVAVSGAAASSNMGYFSPSPFVTLVLTFFNARLGWWLGNPGVHGAGTFFRSHPQSALSPILDEAFGLTDDTNPYVLLSDGGHFENLGLYEMVLRRCRHIVVVDGSADPAGSLDDLGGAVRKIRIDLGIPIEFKPPFPILPRPASEEKGAGGYCAVGDIHYEAVDADPSERGARLCPRGRHRMTGRLVYVKPTIYGTEPRDVFNYAASHPDFPHESTADQFFDEPQFESHRMLGYYILEELFAEAARTSPAGENPCDSRDIRQLFDWLGARAEAERRRALGLEEKEPPPADPGLPFQ